MCRGPMPEKLEGTGLYCSSYAKATVFDRQGGFSPTGFVEGDIKQSPDRHAALYHIPPASNYRSRVLCVTHKAGWVARSSSSTGRGRRVHQDPTVVI